MAFRLYGKQPELGRDCRLSTWVKLFDALAYVVEIDWLDNEEGGDLLREESYRREERRDQGLCAGKRRW